MGGKKKILAVDFDGTLVTEAFPKIGDPKKDVIDWVKKQEKHGHKIILWTCREGDLLLEAVKFCVENKIELDAVNENVVDLKFSYLGQHKIIADVYLDDKSGNINEMIKLDDINNFK